MTRLTMQYKLLSAHVCFLSSIFLLVTQLGHAAPVRPPDLRRCQTALDHSVAGPSLTLPFNCCLPVPKPYEIVDFSFERYPPLTKHVRTPAHRASKKYIATYIRAYELMRALPADDPRSWVVQHKFHCAFCNGAYKQAGASDDVLMQVHYSSIFLPWHRWFLYFHERILAKLLGDNSFSLVFWNWDDQQDGGNVMPAMFARNGTSLYDAKRNQDHLPPAIVRMITTSTTKKDSEIVKENLNSLYKSLVTASTPELFLGGAYRIGTDLSNSTVLDAPLGGSLENGPHNAVHNWTGDPTQPLGEDMGTFSSAARDPIFFAHHSNVDRLWEVWRSIPGGRRQDYSDRDFLDAEFIFYDENAKLVKVKARDALDNKKLGVSYTKVRADELWLNFSPQAATNGSAAAGKGIPEIGAAPKNGTIQLGDKLTALVRRPSGRKPHHKEEVLLIQGVEVTRDSFVQLVVFVNLPDADENTQMSGAEFVGTSNILPSSGKHKHIFMNVKFEIGDNLKRIGIQNDDKVVITVLVKPYASHVDVTIKGMQIIYE